MVDDGAADGASETANDSGAKNAAASPAAPPLAGAFVGAPEGFVRGGTNTFAHDMMIAEREAEAEARRRAADADKALVKDGAQVYTNRLTEHGQVPRAYVLLKYMTERGEPLYDHGQPVECLADIVMLNPKDPSELTLILVCPKCKERMPQDQCQIQIRQSNRSWHLDQRDAFKPIVFEGQVYQSAGTVMDSERFSCPSCTWSARIDRNRVRPE